MIDKLLTFQVRCDDCGTEGSGHCLSERLAQNVAIGVAHFELRGKEHLCPTCALKRDEADTQLYEETKP